MLRNWHKFTLLVATMLIAVGVLGDTYTGKPDPYNKTTTITIPTGTYLKPDAAISSSATIYSGVSVVSDGGLSARSATVTGPIYSSESIVSDGGLSARSATVSGNISAAGTLIADGGLQLGQGSSVLTKFLKGTVTVYGADAGIAEGACTTDVVFSAPGVTSNSICMLQESETMGEKYHCEVHYTGADQLHWECCCTDNPTCGWIAPVTTGWFCHE